MPLLSRVLLLAGLLAFTPSAHAQWSDDFSDGDFSSNPSWSGDGWRVIPWNGDFALQSDGPQARDTLSLTTPSEITIGNWHFTFAYDSVNLSNFNGLRVFLMADTEALEGPVRGYYVQFGTNNSDQVRFYRMDGDPSDGRVLLGASREELLSASSDTLAISVIHSIYGNWSVSVDGKEIIKTHDATYDDSRFFGFWIKHTDDHRRSFVLDDVRVEPARPPDFDAPSPGDIVINEIMYDPPSGISEYVELYNRSERTFDLGRLLLADDSRNGQRVVRQAVPFPPNSYVVVVEDVEGLNVPAYEIAAWPSLNNDEDLVVLSYGETIIDAVPYEASWGGWGVSLERTDPRGPSWHPINFGSSQSASGDTPGERNSIFAPDRTPPHVTFVEQVDDNLLHVYFDEPLATGQLAPEQFSTAGDVSAQLRVLSDTAVGVTFSGDIVGGDLMIEGVWDLFQNSSAEQSHPVAWLPLPGELVINELLHDPVNDDYDGLPNQPEYIELYNTGNRLLTLHGAFVTGPPNEEAVADTSHISDLPVELAPGAYAVIYSGTESATFKQIFSIEENALLLPVDGIGLSNSGDLVRLHRVDGDTLETLTFSAEWEAPFASGPGIALERIDASGKTNDPLNWSSSREGGTPGRRNSITPHPEARAPQPGDLAINEIMFAPESGAPEYVELYNNGEHVLELNGLYMAGANGSDSLRIAYVPTTLQPGEYAIVHSQPAPEAGFPQDARLLIANETSLGLSNEGELLAFYNAGKILLTSVHYLPDWHHPHLEETEGMALERFHPSAPKDKPASWSSSVAPGGGTPGRRNSIYLAPSAESPEGALSVQPVTFSPDGDGFDDATHLSYTLKSKAPRIRIRIFDDHGRLVRILRQSALAGRSGNLLWDGRDGEDHDLPVGIYIVLLEAVDPARGIVEAYKAPVVVARTRD